MHRSYLLSLFLWFCLPVSRFINRVNWRFGRPFCCTGEDTKMVKNHLHPGMVILTHKKYEFSTMFIPGYWTHSALVVAPGRIIEATGHGVCMNTMGSFFSTIDDFVVLRPRFCCQETMKKAGEQAVTLVGSPFSFDFRNTGEMFYCSGLVCWVYAQTLINRENLQDIPLILKNFIAGNIIKPMDLYLHQDALQIMGNYTDLKILDNTSHEKENSDLRPGSNYPHSDPGNMSVAKQL